MTHISHSPFADAQSNWVSMVEALDAAEDAKRQSDQLAIRLLAETDMLRDQLAEANAERKLWHAYAIAMDTKLALVADVIDGARNAARQEAKDSSNEPEARVVADPQIAPQRPSETIPELVEQLAPEPIKQNEPITHTDIPAPVQRARPVTPLQPDTPDEDFKFVNGMPRSTALPPNQF